MHIPDGLISPETCVAGYVAMTPLWVVASRQVRKEYRASEVPMLGVGAALAFTLMMFNVPALGGTTAHAVGSTMVAILVGPWAAVIAVSVALAIQALLFADGGLMAFGVNAFCMAGVMPWVGYTVYRLLLGSGRSTGRKAISGAIGAYIAIVVASAMVALVLGIQPVLHPGMYFPFGLKVTLAGMVPTHLLIAGPLEAAVTAAAVRFAASADLQETSATPRWIGVLVSLLVLSPLGLLASGDAWGEWDAETLKSLSGVIPHGYGQGYAGIPGLQDYAGDRGGLAYITAGLIGVLVVGAVFVLLARSVLRSSAPSAVEPLPAPTLGIPDWLREKPAEFREKSPRSNRFIQKTILDTSRFVRQSIFAEDWARRARPIRAIHPNARVLGWIGLLVATSFTKTPTQLAVIAMVAAGLWVAVSPPWKEVMLRVAPFLAITSLAVGLPAVLFLHQTQAWMLVARVTLALLLSILLSLSQPWQELLAALSSLRLSATVVMLVQIAYRYIEVLCRATQDVFSARLSRTVGPTPNGEGRAFTGFAAGAVLGKSLSLSQQVHWAMISRGFDGHSVPLEQRRFRVIDIIWLGCIVGVFALCVF